MCDTEDKWNVFFHVKREANGHCFNMKILNGENAQLLWRIGIIVKIGIVNSLQFSLKKIYFEFFFSSPVYPDSFYFVYKEGLIFIIHLW